LTHFPKTKEPHQAMHLPKTQNPFIRFAPQITALVLLICGVAGLQQAKLHVQSDPESMLESDVGLLTTFKMVEAALERASILLISMECDDVFTVPNLRTMHDICETFSKESGVIDVKSFTHSSIPYRDGMRLKYRNYLPDELTQASLADIREFSTTHPLVRNLLVSEDGRQGMIVVTYTSHHFAEAKNREAYSEHVETLLAPYTSDARSFRTLSAAQVQNDIEAILKHDMRAFGYTAGVFLVLGCLIYFRTLPMIAYVITMLAGYLLLLNTFLSAAGAELSFVSIAFFPLLVGIQLMLLAHLCRTFRLQRQAGDDVPQACANSVRYIWKSCLFATLTTMAGLLALAFSGYAQSTNMGLMGSVSVLAGLLFTFGPGISLLRVFHWKSGPAKPSAKRERTRKPVSPIPRMRLGLCAIVLLALALTGIARITTDIQLLNMLPPDSFTRRMAEDFESLYGGKTFLRLSLDSGKAEGITRPALLQSMMRIQTHAESFPMVSGTYSYASIMAMINEVWQGWKPDSFVLPNPFMMGLFDTLLQTQEFPFTDALYSTDRRMGYVYIRTKAMPSAAYLTLVEDLQAFAEAQLPSDVKLVVDEGLHSLLTADRRMLTAQARTFAATVAVIALVLLVLWRSVRLTCIALSVVVMPLLVTLGVAGYLGIPLNSVTFMLCAIVAGIAVDDVVHFVTFWKGRRETVGDEQALQDAMHIKGTPIVFTSILLIVVFALFGTTSFPPAIHFGLLSALAFLLTLVAVLGVLPSLLIKKHRVP
jgi:predicted RND superfamily exporter protein